MQPVMTALHEHYVWQVNEAVAEDQMDLVQRLKGEVIAASERQACSAAVRPGSCLNLLSVLRSIDPATP